MKNYKIYTAFIILFSLAGCDVFLAPILERQNPNDPANPTPQVTEFQAFGKSPTEVALMWRTIDGELAPNVIILRNENQNPDSVNDGITVYDGPTNPGGDGFATNTDFSAEGNIDYFYAIWAYTEKDGQRIYNGPLTDGANTYLQTIDIPAYSDGYVTDDTMYFNPLFNDIYLKVTTNTTTPENSYILMRFDPGFEMPAVGSINYAELRLFLPMTGNTSTTFWDVSAANIIQPWDEYDTSSNLIASIENSAFSTFADLNTASVLTLPDGASQGGDQYFFWDITQATTSVLFYGTPNYGIILRSLTAETSLGAGISFSSWEDGYYDGPMVTIYYYGDPPPDN